MNKSEDKSNRTKIVVAVIGAVALIIAAIIGVAKNSESQLTIRVEDGTGEPTSESETQAELDSLIPHPNGTTTENAPEVGVPTPSEPQSTGDNSLSFGQTVSGAITLPAETDMYTFAASSGDTVVIRASCVSGTFWPEITLNAPDGRELRTESGTSSVELRETLPTTGTYSILIGDGFNGTDTGDYNINLQKIPRLP